MNYVITFDDGIDVFADDGFRDADALGDNVAVD